MCGIVGILNLDDRPVQPDRIRNMTAQLHHRGPDAAGAFLDRALALGHSRLSIIDLVGGRQPMGLADGSLWVTFNGEIFNYIELREELAGLGCRFATRSDTEVILHAYRQWGDRCVERFNGQWAFAIWDRRQRRLFLSRDRFGIRPLYWWKDHARFLFASELKALFADPGVERCLDPVGLNQVFTYWTTLAPKTVFEGIEELPAGCSMAVENGRVRSWRYWEPDFQPDPLLDERRASEELMELLVDAVRIRLRSDVPVGAYLSGGLDSSITSALVRTVTDAHLETFSVAFDDGQYDESRYQRMMVEQLATEHHELRCHGEEIGRAFADAVFHAERPILRTAPAPLYLLAESVRGRGTKVVLTGEGADEVFGGYDLFKEAKVRRFWAAEPGSSFRGMLLKKLYPYMPRLQAQSPAYLQAFFRAGPADLASPFFSHLPRWSLTAGLKRFLQPAWAAADESAEPFDDFHRLLPQAFHSWTGFGKAQYLEMAALLPGYILSSQGDRMLMAHGVEGRFPFLDHRLAELAGRFPPRWKMKGLREKHLLKNAARNLVPEAILGRAKQPYRAPESPSFFGTPDRPIANPYAEEMLSHETIEQGGVFQTRAVAALVRKLRSGAGGVKDNMALVGILSTQILIDRLIRNFTPRKFPANWPHAIFDCRARLPAGCFETTELPPGVPEGFVQSPMPSTNGASQ